MHCLSGAPVHCLSGASVPCLSGAPVHCLSGAPVPLLANASICVKFDRSNTYPLWCGFRVCYMVGSEEV